MAASGARAPVLLLIGTLVWLTVAACSAAPVPSPTPTPTAISTPSAQELLDRMMTALLGLETVRFSLTHEAGGTDLDGGLLLNVEGEASFPDRASLNATAAFSALRVNLGMGIVQIGDKAYRQDPLNRSWEEAAPASLPFLFADINRSVAEAMAASEQVQVTGAGEVDGAAVYMLSGSVLSDALVLLLATMLATSKSGTLWKPRDQVLDGGLLSSLRALL